MAVQGLRGVESTGLMPARLRACPPPRGELTVSARLTSRMPACPCTRRPKLQLRVVRILWMVPIYAVDSWLSLRFKEAR